MRSLSSFKSHALFLAEIQLFLELKTPTTVRFAWNQLRQLQGASTMNKPFVTPTRQDVWKKTLLEKLLVLRTYDILVFWVIAKFFIITPTVPIGAELLPSLFEGP